MKRNIFFRYLSVSGIRHFITLAWTAWREEDGELGYADFEALQWHETYNGRRMKVRESEEKGVPGMEAPKPDR